MISRSGPVRFCKRKKEKKIRYFSPSFLFLHFLLNMEREFFNAVYEGKLDEVKRILIAHPEVDVNWWWPVKVVSTTAGWSSLHAASARGHPEILHLLLLHPKIIVNQGTDNMLNALHVACNTGNTATVRILLQDERVDVNQATMTQSSTPLKEAIWYGHVEVVKWMIASGRPIQFSVDDGRRIPGSYRNRGKNAQEAAILVEKFWKNEESTRAEVKKELGVNGKTLLLKDLLLKFDFWWFVEFMVFEPEVLTEEQYRQILEGKAIMGSCRSGSGFLLFFLLLMS